MELKAPLECSELQPPEQPPASLHQHYMNLLHDNETQTVILSPSKQDKSDHILTKEIWGKDGKPIIARSFTDLGGALFTLQTGPKADMQSPSTWNTSYQRDEYDLDVLMGINWVQQKSGGMVNFNVGFNYDGKIISENGVVVDSNNHTLSHFMYEFDGDGHATKCNREVGPKLEFQTIWQKQKLE